MWEGQLLSRQPTKRYTVRAQGFESVLSPGPHSSLRNVFPIS